MGQEVNKEMSKSAVWYLHGFVQSNRNFREVLATPGKQQLVLMSLKPLEEIGSEVHSSIDQFFYVEQGRGEVTLDGKKLLIGQGDGIMVTHGTEHNIKNISQTQPLQLFTIYAPPAH